MNKLRIIDQLKVDEGFTGKAKWDIKQYTYGYGTRAAGPTATITEPEAAVILEQKVDECIADFNRIFKGHQHKFNDVRAEAFVNMIFNMGPGRKDAPSLGGLYSFVNTLNLIFKNKNVCWPTVADNLQKSLWFRQVKHSGDTDGPGPDKGRGVRIVEEIRTGVKG